MTTATKAKKSTKKDKNNGNGNGTTTTPAVEAKASPLKSKAMLVYVGFSKLSKSKKDQGATSDVITAAGADEDAGAFIKKLFPPKNPHIRAVEAVLGKAYNIYERETLPWADGGGRLLPAVNFTKFAEAMRIVKDELDIAVAELESMYTDIVNAQAVRLGSLFNRDDYPTSVKESFGIYVSYYPVPTGEDFRVDLMEESVAEQIRAEIDANSAASFEDAAMEVYGRLWDVATRMRDILDPAKPKSSIKNQLIEDMRAAVAAIPRFNILDDSRLVTLGARIERELCALDGPALRENEMARAKVQEKAMEVVADLNAILGIPA